MNFLFSPHLRFALKTIAASALLSSASGQIVAQTAVNTGTGSVRQSEPVTLNFANAEIEAVARTMATITGRNVVVDPRVKGQLNLVTERAVPPAAAFQQFLAALRLQGFTVVSLQPIRAGAQVYDSYGRKCNHRFLLNYGFSVENNVETDGFCPNEVRE